MNYSDPQLLWEIEHSGLSFVNTFDLEQKSTTALAVVCVVKRSEEGQRAQLEGLERKMPFESPS